MDINQLENSISKEEWARACARYLKWKKDRADYINGE